MDAAPGRGTPGKVASGKGKGEEIFVILAFDGRRKICY